MKSHSHRILTILAVAALAALGWLLTSNREPVYEGKRLSQWLEGFSLAQPQDTEEPEAMAREAAHAVRQIGTNALPSLLKMLRARDSALKRRLMYWAGRQSAIHFELIPAEDLRHRAVYGFKAIGATAQSAIPSILPLLADSQSGRDAAMALAGMGSPGQAALRESLSHHSPEVLVHAIVALSQSDAKLDAVLPGLLRTLNHEQFQVRVAATSALGKCLGEEARTREAATQGLKKLAQDENALVRQQAFLALRVHHPNPETIIPLFAKALHDPDVIVRTEALDGLHRIAPAEPAMIVPLATQSLDDGESRVRVRAAMVLAAYRDKARPAVPALLELHKRSQETERAALARALWEIDPETARRAEVQRPNYPDKDRLSDRDGPLL